MTSSAALQPEPAPLLACTISREVQNFDLLIEDMEQELGESWGDLHLNDALGFLSQPDAANLEFVALALDAEDEPNLTLIDDIISAGTEAGVKILIIAEDVGPSILHQLLRNGADDFIPYPLPEGALHEVIERFRTPPPEPVMMAPPTVQQDSTTLKASGDRDAAILPIHGLSGGVGSTTFAVNLAWELTQVAEPKRRGRKKEPEAPAPRVCLLDFDFQFGSASTYLDLPRKEIVFELLSDTSAMDSESFMNCLQTYNDKLHVLTAPYDMLPLDIVGPEDIAKIIDVARTNFDFIVIDMPTTLVSWSETVLHAAHVYFAMVELDMRSAQNALRMIRTLKAEELPYEKLRFALNRSPKFTDLSGKARVKRLAESLDIDIELMLPDGLKPVVQACDHGFPLAESAAKNPLRKEIQKLSDSLRDLVLTERAGR
jgi:pilus assembly protein CpaE